MEEIDMIKKDREFKNDAIIKYTKSKKGILATSLSFFSLVPFFFVNDVLLGLCIALNSSAAFYHLIVQYKRATDDLYQIKELVTESDDYKECIRLYNEYIGDIAKLLKSIEFKNSKNLIMFLLYMMETGLLSSEERVYHTYKYGKDFLLDDLGIRTVTGKAVCRHTSSFFSDILNTYGITCANYSVTLLDEEKLRKTLIFKPKFNHMINCIQEGKQKYLFDTTSYNFFGSTEFQMKGYEVAESPLNNTYYLINPNSETFNTKYIKQYINLQSLPFEQIQKEQIEDICNNALEKILNKTDIIIDFSKKNKERVEKISYLIKRVCPLSDTKIKEWVLTYRY